MCFKLKTSEIVLAGLFGAIAAVFQIYHPFSGVGTMYGMWIDVVGVPAVASYFLAGLPTALLTSLLTAVVIALFSPDTLVGAVMKLVATLPMFLVPAAVVYFARIKRQELYKLQWFLPVLALALIVRAAVVIPFNYYFAIPLFFKMPTEEAIAFFPPLVMVSLNAIQGVIEFALVWLLCYKTRLRNLKWL